MTEKIELNEKKTVSDVFLPFKVLISPSKAFDQLVQNPSLKGLIPLSALILVAVAATVYAFAGKIFLNINGETSLLATSFFANWYASAFLSTIFYLLMYWGVIASGLALLSKTFGGKSAPWRSVLVALTCLLSVFIVLYVVRTLMYLALPSIYFSQNSSWPPISQSPEESAVLTMFNQNWASLLVYQFMNFFPWVALAWLSVLGAVAIKALRQISLTRASIVSVICVVIGIVLFGLP